MDGSKTDNGYIWNQTLLANARLSQQISMLLNWILTGSISVPGQTGIRGNERAKFISKEGRHHLGFESERSVE